MGFFKKKVSKEELVDEFLRNITNPTMFEEVCLDLVNNMLQTEVTNNTPGIDIEYELSWMDKKGVDVTNKTYIVDGRGKEFIETYGLKIGPYIEIITDYKDMNINMLLHENVLEVGLEAGEDQGFHYSESHRLLTTFSSKNELYEFLNEILINHFGL